MESEDGKSSGRGRSLARRFLVTSKDSSARNDNATHHSTADNNARDEKQASTLEGRSSVAQRKEYIEASGTVHRKSDSSGSNLDNKASGKPVTQRKEVVEASGGTIRRNEVKNNSVPQRKEVIEASGSVTRNHDANRYRHRNTPSSVRQRQEIVEASGGVNRTTDVICVDVYADMHVVMNSVKNSQPRRQEIVEASGGVNRMANVMCVDVHADIHDVMTSVKNSQPRRQEIVEASGGVNRMADVRRVNVHADIHDATNSVKDSQPRRQEIVEASGGVNRMADVRRADVHADIRDATNSVKDSQPRRQEIVEASGGVNRMADVMCVNVHTDIRDATSSVKDSEPRRQEVVEASGGRNRMIAVMGVEVSADELESRASKSAEPRGREFVEASGGRNRNAVVVGSNASYTLDSSLSNCDSGSNRRDERDPSTSSTHHRSSSNYWSRDPRSSHYSRRRDPRHSDSRGNIHSFEEQRSFSRREGMRNSSAGMPPSGLFEEDERLVSHGWKPSIFDDEEDRQGRNRNRYQNNSRNNNGWQPNRKQAPHRNNNRFFNYRDQDARNNRQDSRRGAGGHERSSHASGRNVGSDGNHRSNSQNRPFVIDRNGNDVSNDQQNKRGLNERSQSPETKRTRPGDEQESSTVNPANPSADEDTTNVTLSDQTTSVGKSNENAKSKETPSKKSRYVLLNEMIAEQLNEEQLKQEPIKRMEYEQRKAREAEELRKDRERADRDVFLGEDSCDEVDEPKSLAGAVEGAKSVQKPWNKTERKWNEKGQNDESGCPSPGDKNAEPFSFRLTLDDPENRAKFAEADRERRGPARKRKGGLGSKTAERDGVVRKSSGPVETSVPTGSFDIRAWEKCRQDILRKANANSGSNGSSSNSPTTPTETEPTNNASNATRAGTQSQNEAGSPEITPKGDEVDYQHDCAVVFRYSQLPDKFRWRACRKEMLVDAVKAKLPDSRFYEFNLDTSGNAVHKLLDGDFSTDTWETLKFRAIAEEYKNAVRRVANVRKRRNKKNKKNFMKFGADHNYDQSHFRGRSWRQSPPEDHQNEPPALAQNNNTEDYGEQPEGVGRGEKRFGDRGKPGASGEGGGKRENSQVLRPAMAARYVRNASGNQRT